MANAWQPAGYTSPNLSVYPWMWLWDSCFHSIIWAELDSRRAVIELASIFRWQHDDGFVPHMGYQIDPNAARDIWGRVGASSITQPPMYAHAAKQLLERGIDVPPAVIENIRRSLEFFWTERMDPDGLIRIVHPWESGADDSARWDAWSPTPFSKPSFDRFKCDAVGSLRFNSAGSSVANDRFQVRSSMFNAIVAFNALEFADISKEDGWRERGQRLASALDATWSDDEGLWCDGGDHASACAPTSDAALGVLVCPERADQVWARLTERGGMGAAFGPCNLDRRAPGYDPFAYWRGPTWPQINYLLWIAFARWPDRARQLAAQTLAGATLSGFSEYWHPDTARGGGARPQSWTGLVLLMAMGDGP